MSSVRQLIDFQIAYAFAPVEEQRPINEVLFATYEPVRLWLRSHVVKAPFQKLVVTLRDEVFAARWHGLVIIAVGVAEVIEAVDLAVLRHRVGDHRWLLGLVKHALDRVAADCGWRSTEFEVFIDELSTRPFPLVHHFEKLEQIDPATGIVCIPWLATSPGETRLGVRIGSRNVTIVEKRGPLFLEDEFPVRKSAIRDRSFVLLARKDKKEQLLASVPLDE